SASAHAGTCSSTASLRSRRQSVRRHPLASSLSTSRRLVPPSVAPPHDLPAREWPSASPPLLSPCLWVLRSTHCSKSAPYSAATVLPDKTHRGFSPAPGTCPRQTGARPSARVPSGAAEMLSSWPCLLSTLRPPPEL